MLSWFDQGASDDHKCGTAMTYRHRFRVARRNFRIAVRNCGIRLCDLCVLCGLLLGLLLRVDAAPFARIRDWWRLRQMRQAEL